MNADIIVEVRFRTADEGGRKGAVTGGVYGCPMFIDGEGFECRLILEEKTLLLGETYKIAVKFMNSGVVLSKLKIGQAFTLWEGKVVADGVVERIPLEGNPVLGE